VTQVVGLITEAAQAEQILPSAAADLIALAREALRDPFWPAHGGERLGDVEFRNWPEQYGCWLRARRRLLSEAGEATT
jgi:2,4-dienoyl-CoA reductase-like NADH-dependent reductase (Old Yellow Enzyme family)